MQTSDRLGRAKTRVNRTEGNSVFGYIATKRTLTRGEQRYRARPNGQLLATWRGAHLYLTRLEIEKDFVAVPAGQILTRLFAVRDDPLVGFVMFGAKT